MPIYNGTVKVNPSGITKVYNGTQLVYQSGPSIVPYDLIWYNGASTTVSVYPSLPHHCDGNPLTLYLSVLNYGDESNPGRYNCFDYYKVSSNALGSGDVINYAYANYTNNESITLELPENTTHSSLGLDYRYCDFAFVTGVMSTYEVTLEHSAGNTSVENSSLTESNMGMPSGYRRWTGRRIVIKYKFGIGSNPKEAVINAEEYHANFVPSTNTTTLQTLQDPSGTQFSFAVYRGTIINPADVRITCRGTASSPQYYAYAMIEELDIL